jgi:tRNA (adenine-N(1)-)-methyltransferase non-catalytic subunit
LFVEYATLVNATATGDNRSFTDTNTAQKLTDSDIHQLRDQGASAKDIITSLISNSETWNNKTEFSQEKWLMKKQKKLGFLRFDLTHARYTRKIRVLKATPASLCDVYFRKSNSKIW